MLLCCIPRLLAQPCLPDGIIFTTQSQIDSFPILYPNCDTIEGFVIVDGQDINNLYGLNSIVVVVEGLRIGSYSSLTNPTLYDLNGLNNLYYVGGWLSIVGNQILNSLDGLENLNTIGEDCELKENPSLTSIEGLINLFEVDYILVITNNDSLVDLNGLNNLSAAGGIAIYYNDMLVNIQGLESLTSIEYHIMIFSNNSLINLSGLESLTSIGDELMIEDNIALESLTGIDNLLAETIDCLIIKDNPSLSVCDVQSVCDYIANSQGSLWIYDNNTGCNSVGEVEEACTVGIPESSTELQLSTYPNPFTTSTTIEYELKEISNIQFTIYNVIGEVIYQAEDRVMRQGSHKVTWSPGHLPEGLYYAVLRSEEGVSVVKMVKQ